MVRRGMSRSRLVLRMLMRWGGTRSLCTRVARLVFIRRINVLIVLSLIVLGRTRMILRFGRGSSLMVGRLLLNCRLWVEVFVRGVTIVLLVVMRMVLVSGYRTFWLSFPKFSRFCWKKERRNSCE